MRCPACGQESADQSRFCSSCGAPLGVTSTLSETPALQTQAAPTAQAAEPSPPPPPLSFANGRYQVVRVLGEGGSKIVYLVSDNFLDREVALALIKIGGFDEQEKARITREAQAMAKLGDHPNIVTIYDVGEDAGRPYIVTQYMAGGSVDELMRKSPHHHLPIDQAIRIGDEVCQALEYAHARGIVHRDLKPGNVWLTREGTSKLGDFGLALAAGQPRLTVAGLVAGTAAYMAPEQVMGKPVDARSDLYSLGAMLYEMVTGRPPFLGDNIATVIAQQLNSEPLRPAQLLPDVPPALDQLILKLLAKTPDQRFADAAAVRKELAPLNNTIERSEPGVSKSGDIGTAVARNLSELNLHEAPDGTVSLLFSDIEGSTAMWERLGDLKAVEVLHDHDSIVRKQVEAHQGFVANTTGDGFFVTFKTVRQALLCAIEIQRDLIAYSKSHPDQPLRIRIGLHVGEAKRESNDYHGNAVNFAARVMGHANGGEITTSASFMDLAKDAGDIRFDHGREVALKGFPDTYRIYRVAWNVTDAGEWLCPNCTTTIPKEQRVCVACAESAKAAPTQTAMPAATSSPIDAAGAPIPAMGAARSPLPRILVASALLLLMAITSFAGVYFFKNPAAIKQLPFGEVASVGGSAHLQGGQTSLAPKPTDGRPVLTVPAQVAPLNFTSMSLQPCNKPLPHAVYTKEILSDAGCLSWSAKFSPYADGMQTVGDALQATIYDPQDQVVSRGASDRLSGDPQTGQGAFDGSVSIPDLTDYPTGKYRMVLSAGDNEITQRAFYVVENDDFQDLDGWLANFASDYPGEVVPNEVVVIETHREIFFDRLDRHRRFRFGRRLSAPYPSRLAVNKSFSKNPTALGVTAPHHTSSVTEATNPYKASAPGSRNPFRHEPSQNPMTTNARRPLNPFKPAPPKTYANPFERQPPPNSAALGGHGGANPFAHQAPANPFVHQAPTNPFVHPPSTTLVGRLPNAPMPHATIPNSSPLLRAPATGNSLLPKTSTGSHSFASHKR